jgi:hypothetical protein
MALRVVVFLLTLSVILVATAIVLSLVWKMVGWVAIPLALLAFVAIAWGIKVAVGRLAMKLFEAPFRMKGAVLRDARTQVHEVRRAQIEAAVQHYIIDLSIQPKADVPTPFRLWNPEELELVPHGTKPGPPADSDDDEDKPEARNPWQIEKIEYWRDGQFVEGLPDEEPQGEEASEGALAANRLRLHAAVPVAAQRVAFRYYFEVFGDVKLW